MPQTRKQLIMLGDRMRCDGGDDGDTGRDGSRTEGMVRHGKEEGDGPVYVARATIYTLDRCLLAGLGIELEKIWGNLGGRDGYMGKIGEMGSIIGVEINRARPALALT